MIAQIVIAFYFIVCLGIILFNCASGINSKWYSFLLEKRKKIYVQEYQCIFLNAIPDEKKRKYEKKLKKELCSISKLLTFQETLYDIEKNRPEEFRKGISSLSKFMENLIPVYKKKSVREQVCLAYLFARYQMTAFQTKETVVSFLFQLLENESIYCRENALRAIYGSNDENLTLEALKMIDSHKTINEKILVDGLLYFERKEELIALLWKKLDEFSTEMQVNLLNFIRFASDRWKDEMLSKMEKSGNMEIQIACVRYFYRYPDKRSLPFLLCHADEEQEKRWELQLACIAALVSYPNEQTMKLLKKEICSRNWHIRQKAAQTLIGLNVEKKQLEDILQGNDPFAREMLMYQMELARKRREKVIS